MAIIDGFVSGRKIANKFSFNLLILLLIALVVGAVIEIFLFTQARQRASIILDEGFRQVKEQQEAALFDEVNSALNIAADGLALNVLIPLAQKDIASLKFLSEQLTSISDLSTGKFSVEETKGNQKIAYINYLNPLGERVYSYRTKQSSETSKYKLVRPVQQGKNLIGFVEIGANISSIEENINELLLVSNTITDQQVELLTSQELSAIINNAIGFFILALFIFFMIRIATHRLVIIPLRNIENAIHNMQVSGDFSTQLQVRTEDEIGNLTKEVNHAFTYLQEENEKINDAVVSLLTYAGDIANKHDLSIKVPITEDVTGLVADALNNLTSEFGEVLDKVKQTSQQLSLVSEEVRNQNLQVVKSSQEERKTLDVTTISLQKAIDVMKQIAKYSSTGNEAAKDINHATGNALQSLEDSIQGMNAIRDNIQETGKRIKRLGERSQEITVIVDIINNIAERTNVLALNAGIQAAAAGEAGKTFTVIAAEVQHLAENSRNATAQIATLVKNIQAETADTMSAMDRAITEVITQSKLVETAGQTMEKTKEAVAVSSKAVEKITENSVLQIQVSQRLIQELGKIRHSAEQTATQLAEQEKQINDLVSSTEAMSSSVGIFRLPS